MCWCWEETDCVAREAGVFWVVEIVRARVGDERDTLVRVPLSSCLAALNAVAVFNAMSACVLEVIAWPVYCCGDETSSN